jgi:predicted nucleic acid-binding protein
MLVDTDVLIWYMRGNLNALQKIKEITDFSISVVTYIELIQGMRNKRELVKLRKFIAHREIKIIYINEDISVKAMFYIECHFLSHSLALADALIAATAINHGLTLLTGNDKHYQIITDVNIKKFRP